MNAESGAVFIYEGDRVLKDVSEEGEYEIGRRSFVGRALLTWYELALSIVTAFVSLSLSSLKYIPLPSRPKISIALLRSGRSTKLCPNRDEHKESTPPSKSWM